MGEHTPTPWETRAGHVYSTASNVCTVSEPHASKFVGYTELEIGSPHSGEAFANAAFIVKAVNSHDALVKALRPFIEALPGHEHAKLIDKRYGDFNPIQATVTKAQMQAAREALAKVAQS